jgi:hypothetical protein
MPKSRTVLQQQAYDRRMKLLIESLGQKADDTLQRTAPGLTRVEKNHKVSEFKPYDA